MRIRLPLQSKNVGDVPAAFLLAILPAGLVALHLGWPSPWQGLSMPVSVFLFGLVWGLWMMRRTGGISVLGLGLWVFGVHLSMWVPLILASYVSGHGVAQLDYSVSATIVTAMAVAWYILSDNVWLTVAFGVCLLGAVSVLRGGSGPHPEIKGTSQE